MTAPYAVYYGADVTVWRQLRGLGMVILAAEAWPARRLAVLRRRGTRVLAYLSVGEAGPGEAVVGPILGINPTWGSRFLDVCEADVQHMLRARAVGLRARGVDGLFLDTVDVVDAFPRLLPCVAAVLRALRADWPQAYLLQNRGIPLLSTCGDVVDGVLLENCADRRYGPADRAWLESACQTVRRLGLDGYVLDYASSGDAAEAGVRLARQHGFSHYLAPHPRLDRLY